VTAARTVWSIASSKRKIWQKLTVSRRGRYEVHVILSPTPEAGSYLGTRPHASLIRIIPGKVHGEAFRGFH
jgi:hypothetical protein